MAPANETRSRRRRREQLSWPPPGRALPLPPALADTRPAAFAFVTLMHDKLLNISTPRGERNGAPQLHKPEEPGDGTAEALGAPLQLTGQSLAPLHPPRAWPPLTRATSRTQPSTALLQLSLPLTPSPSCVPDARLHLGAARGQPQLGPFFFPKTVPEPPPPAPPRTETQAGFVKELY